MLRRIAFKGKNEKSDEQAFDSTRNRREKCPRRSQKIRSRPRRYANPITFYGIEKPRQYQKLPRFLSRYLDFHKLISYSQIFSSAAIFTAVTRISVAFSRSLSVG